MRLSAPSVAIFVVSVIVALLAILADQGTKVPIISDSPFWGMVAAWGLLVLGCVLRRI